MKKQNEEVHEIPRFAKATQIYFIKGAIYEYQ